MRLNRTKILSLMLAIGLSIPVGCFSGINTSYSAIAQAEESDTLDTAEAMTGDFLSVDSQNVFSGMKASYDAGYVPSVSGDKVRIVVPMLSEQTIKNDQITAQIDFSGMDSSVFCGSNIKKTLTGQTISGNATQKRYLFDEMLLLNADRKNGTYPVQLVLKGKDAKNNIFTQNITVYVKISDQKNQTEDETPLSIENQKVYSGMEKSYSNGYMPTVKNGKAEIVLPIISSEMLSGKLLTAAIDAQSLNQSVFKIQNIEKRFTGTAATSGKEKYLVRFSMPLQEKRKNGTYPVTIKLSGKTKKGTKVAQSFQVYVNIRDGVQTKKTHKAEKAEAMSSKLIVAKWEYGVKEIPAGKKIPIRALLKNTDTKHGVRNITISIQTQEEGFTIDEGTNTQYIDKIGAGQSRWISYQVFAKKSVKSGQCSFTVSANYEGDQGNALTMETNCFVNICHPMRVKLEVSGNYYDIEDGDMVPYTLHIMNLGKDKMINARCSVKGKEVHTMTTQYIGQIDGESDLQCEIMVLAERDMEKKEDSYAEGKVLLKYEDENGREYQKEEVIGLDIKPIQADKTDEDDKGLVQWWWTLGGIAAAIVIIVIARKVIRMRKNARKEIE